MYSEPRNWKWMVPAAGVAVVPAAGWWMLQLMGEWGGVTVKCLAALTIPVALILLVQAASMYRAYYRSLAVSDLERQQTALSITAESVKLDAAKSVHPQTLELLLRDQARRWGLISATRSNSRKPYAVLFARPRVTEAFFVHFLKMSNGVTYMPISMLSEGDKSWDPDGRVSAREMYEDVESLLHEEGKATRPMGKYKPGYWVAGWTPEKVAMDFKIDLEEWDYDNEEQSADAGKSARGDRSDPINRALNDLEQTAWMKQINKMN